MSSIIKQIGSIGRLRLIAFALMTSLWAPSATAATIYAVTTGSVLISFDSATPGTIIANVPITGLQGAETVYGIDFRPSTGQLYALAGTQDGTSISAQIYTLNPSSGVATDLAPGPETIVGTSVGFDFNPVADKIRVTTNDETNLRFDPTGALFSVDASLNPPGNIVDVAYDRSFPGSTLTTLFAIDSDSDSVMLIGGTNGAPSPNTGTVFTGINIGLDFDEFSAINYGGSTLYAILRVGGISRLYTVDPSTPGATVVGNIGGTPQIVGGMAVAPEPLTLTKASIKLNFAQPLKDAISVSGILPIDAGFVIGGQQLTVDVGGTSKTFTLDEKGKAKVGTDSASVKVKAKAGVVLAQDAKFKISLKNGSFAASLLDDGLVNATVVDVPVTVPISVTLGTDFRQSIPTLTYKAKAGKTGSAK